MRALKLALLLLLFLAQFGAAQATIKVGMNVAPEDYGFTERAFLNIMKSGGGWVTQSGSSIDTSEEALLYQSFLDSNGYPTTLTGGPTHTFDRLMAQFYLNAPSYRAGRYVFLYDGVGTFSYGGDAAKVSEGGQPSGAGTGRVLFDVATPTTGGFQIKLLTTGSPYAKNFRVIYAPTATTSVVDPNEVLVNANQQTVTGAANNGSGLIRLAVSNSSYWTTGDKLVVSAVGGTTEANGFWPITVIDGTHIDLQGSTFTNAYTSGGGVGDLSKSFNSEFLATIPPFKSLRFLDWTGTLGNVTQDWSDRIPPAWAFWNDTPIAATKFGIDPDLNENSGLNVGRPWEVEFSLAAKIGADAWINVPYLATDTYVNTLATLAHTMLAPSGLKIYPEFSNELWNIGNPGDTGNISNITASISGTTLTVTVITPTTNGSGVTQTVILGPGIRIDGAGITDRTTITANGTGAGGIGTYTINHSLTVLSEAMTTSVNIGTLMSNLTLAQFSGVSSFNDGQLRTQWGILRAVQIGHIFKTQWGADAALVRRVMAGQNADTAVASYNLSTLPDGSGPGSSLGGPSFWFGTTAGTAGSQTDVWAVAPYVGQRYNVPNSWTGEVDGGKTKLLTQMISGGLIPTGSGANTTAGTSTAYTLTTDASWGNGSLTEPPANGTMIQFVLNQTSGANPTLKADASSPHPIFDHVGGATSGLGTGTYVASYTSATSAGSVTAGWRLVDAAVSLQGMIFDEINYTFGSAASNLAVATTYGLELAAYEGGPGLEIFNDPLLNPLYLAVQTDSRMGTVIMDELNAWTAIGGGLFNYYEFTRQDGSSEFWGVLTDASQTTSVKYAALINFINGSTGGTHGGASWIGRLGMLDLKPANDNNPWLIKVAQ